VAAVGTHSRRRRRGPADARRLVDSLADDDKYSLYHAPRYAFLLGLLDGCCTPNSRILDIGYSRLTEALRSRYHVKVDVLGFGPDSRGAGGDDYHFDLNDAQEPARWRHDLPEYDIVVMAEVLEHLCTAPTLVLRFLRTHVAPGGVLVLQTPNAVALERRLKLLAGSNPFPLIHEDRTNPGHFREYTRAELRSLAESAGFRVERAFTRSYFDHRYISHVPGRGSRGRRRGALVNAVYALMPPSLSEGHTFVLRRV
jgi:SAM-dependent methyltransferase